MNRRRYGMMWKQVLGKKAVPINLAPSYVDERYLSSLSLQNNINRNARGGRFVHDTRAARGGKRQKRVHVADANALEVLLRVA